MRKDYKEKIEQGKEFVEEHKDSIKKALIGAGLIGVGMIFGAKICDKTASVNVKKHGFEVIERVLDAGARSMLDVITDYAPDALDVMDKAMKDKEIDIKNYYFMQPEIAALVAKHSMKVK